VSNAFSKAKEKAIFMKEKITASHCVSKLLPTVKAVQSCCGEEECVFPESAEQIWIH